MAFGTAQNVLGTFAQKLDGADPLHPMRHQFHLPCHQGHDEIYLFGNSLGRQPKRTADYVDELLKNWQRLGVKGHFAAKHSWLPYHELLTDASATHHQTVNRFFDLLEMIE